MTCSFALAFLLFAAAALKSMGLWSQNAPRPAPPTSTTPMAGITGRRGAGKTCENDPIKESHPPDGR